jgi:hypothetical protein
LVLVTQGATPETETVNQRIQSGWAITRATTDDGTPKAALERSETEDTMRVVLTWAAQRGHHVTQEVNAHYVLATIWEWRSGKRVPLGTAMIDRGAVDMSQELLAAYRDLLGQIESGDIR